MPSKAKIGWGVVVLVLVAVNLFLGVSYPLPPAPEEFPELPAAAGVNVRVEKALVAENYLQSSGTLAVTGATTLGSTLAVTGATTLGSTLTVTGATTLAGLNKLTAGSSITVTNGAAFALTSTLQPIAAAGAVTPTLTIPAAGVAACIYNTGTNAILIQDTGNQVLTANATLGQYDVLCGFSDGTRFIETSRANN